MRSGQELAIDLERHRERDREVLEPDLVAAIDRFQGEVGGAIQLCDMVQAGLTDYCADTEKVALQSVVAGAKDFAEVLAKYAPSWMEVLPLMKESAASISARQRSEP